ncbi:MAG: hypothetical protein M1594_00345 [Candidatus Marsarchaeota archaeon]|nr:hypothetical protein [Candidatus Marsarchaeota archaeon]
MLKRLMILSIIAVLVSSASFSIRAPAVDSSGNGVISIINVKVVNGNGMVFTDIGSSLVNTDTENSMKTAAQVGAGFAGVDFSNYNYYFSVYANASEIDGPSAGLAFTLGVIQDFFAIENSSKAFRSDFTVTGTINSDGSVGVVGGVSDKIIAAGGKVNLMLIPSGQSLLDGVDYAALGSGLSKPVQVVEVANVSQAVNFLLTPTNSVLKGVPSHTLTVLNPIPFNYSNSTLPMKQVALLQIQSAEKDLSLLLALNNSNKANIAVINQTLLQAVNYTNEGYFYTAANTAFLVENNIDSLLLGNVSSFDFQKMLAGLLSNMSGFNFTSMNSNNFEWVAGAELRYFWALEELNQINSSFSVLPTPSYFTSDFVTAKNWFEAAVDLNNLASGISGSSVNDFNARNYALKVLNESSAFENSSSDSFFHYTSALAEFNAGDYAASSMDSMFVFAYSNNSLNFTSFYPSVWAEVYQAQGFYNEQFYNFTKSQSSESNYVFLKLLSNLLSGNAGMIVQGFSTPLQINENQTVSNKTNNAIQVQAIASYTPFVSFNYMWIGVAAIILILIFMVVLILSSSRTERKPEEIIDKFDVALAEGRISEKTHEKLVKKWKEKITKKEEFKFKRKG